MSCRNDPDDPRKCERCGQFLWVAEEGLYCGECGATMPCTMRVLPIAIAPLVVPGRTEGPAPERAWRRPE